MLVVKNYESFNQRRYSNPWIAKVGTDGKMDFTTRVGNYTGSYGKGEAGQLYLSNPTNGTVYAYGQKDNRGNNGGYQYIKMVDGNVQEIEKTALIEAL